MKKDTRNIGLKTIGASLTLTGQWPWASRETCEDGWKGDFNGFCWGFCQENYLENWFYPTQLEFDQPWVTKKAWIAFFAGYLGLLLAMWCAPTPLFKNLLLDGLRIVFNSIQYLGDCPCTGNSVKISDQWNDRFFGATPGALVNILHKKTRATASKIFRFLWKWCISNSTS